DLDGLTAAEGDVENERNQVRFGLVSFAAKDFAASLSAGFRGSCDVEVAERSRAKAVNAVKPLEHVLDEEFGFAVGVGGLESGVLRNGNVFRFAVDSGGRAEDETLGTFSMNGLK